MDYEIIFWCAVALGALGFIGYCRTAFGPSQTVSDETLRRLR